MEHKDTKTQSFIPLEEYNRLQALSNTIIGAAIEVHRELGPGLLESVYEECLRVELESQGLDVKTQVDFPLIYKGKDTGKVFIKPLHEVQLVTYMKLTDTHMGLLINFNVPVLKEGIKRKINGKIEYTGIKPIRA